MVGDPGVSPIGPSRKTLCPASPSLQWVPWALVPHLTGQLLSIGVGSEEAPRRAGLRPPHKRLVRFSRKPLSQRCLSEGSRKESVQSIAPARNPRTTDAQEAVSSPRCASA